MWVWLISAILLTWQGLVDVHYSGVLRIIFFGIAADYEQFHVDQMGILQTLLSFSI